MPVTPLTEYLAECDECPWQAAFGYSYEAESALDEHIREAH